MNKQRGSIDLARLAVYILKRCWLLIICAAIGFGFMYTRESRKPDTYTATRTMYVYNQNPNMVNYQYASSSDINSALRLMDTYMVVVRSNKVMDVVVERLMGDYPGITAGQIAGTLSMGSVSQTGVMQVRCRTNEPKKAADICNAVMDVAPAEIIRVVGAGNIEIIDYATAPTRPDAKNPIRASMPGALYGAAAAAALLALLFLMNQRIDSAKELTENYTLPVLAEIRRDKRENDDPSKFLLTDDSAMDNVESYAKLRMNLFYTLVGKDSHTVLITSGISGEGKSTIAANLAISCAMSDRKVLLVDADMRRACQQDLFHYDGRETPGLSDVLVGTGSWRDAIIRSEDYPLDHLPAGHQPPNPAEMLESQAMKDLLAELEQEYDLVLLDSPPINIVSDPMALAANSAGALFVVRQDFSDHREVKKALRAAEMAGLNMLGFVFYGEKLRQGNYYSRRYYKGYYHKYYHRYDTRGGHYAKAREEAIKGRSSDAHENGQNDAAASADAVSGSDRTSRRRSAK